VGGPLVYHIIMSSYDEPNTYVDEYLLMTLIGAPSFIIGTTIKVTSKKYIERSVDLYNNSGGKALKEFDFGFTGNGVGMVMRF